MALTVTGNLQGSHLPAGGVFLDTAHPSTEDATDISAATADYSYVLQFQFANTLSLDALDPALNYPYTDYGDAFFYDANDPYQRYNMGYFGVTGGADPVPESGSLMLLGGSLVGLAFVRRRVGNVLSL